MDRPMDAEGPPASAGPDAAGAPNGSAEMEARLEELEEIAASLGDVPDEEVAGTLERAVTLLREINAGIEARMRAAGENAEKAGELLEGIDLTPFDAAMRDLAPMEPAAPRTEPEGHGGARASKGGRP